MGVEPLCAPARRLVNSAVRQAVAAGDDPAEVIERPHDGPDLATTTGLVLGDGW
ncbi:hypothetical protein [Actinokineospora globicatena]|uniref:hypothetical protein n=1 Tax=Actinokineospora globicatena TaxID=103729 RepID=UPI0020A2BCBC|nr:hypothetical protein [Actinokineospora globicatena]MCP2302671.1 hypothetical protein [Actinokineospora globicatena]